MNLSDSERVSAVLESMGYVKTEKEEEANLLGILACSVRQKPIDKVYNKIAQWNKWKNKRNLITFVSGCLLPADKEKFLKSFDLIFQMSELSQLPEMIREYGVVTPAALRSSEPVMPKNEHIADMWHIQPKYSPPTRLLYLSRTAAINSVPSVPYLIPWKRSITPFLRDHGRGAPFGQPGL